MVTICTILEFGSLGLAWLFLQGNYFSMFGLRVLRRFGNARAEGQVGKLLGIFESFLEFFTTFIVEDVKFRGVAIGMELDKKCFPTGRDLCCMAGLNWFGED